METFAHHHWLISLAVIAALGAAAAIAVVKTFDPPRPLRWTRRRPPLRIELVMGDITTMPVDAIVNAAKSSLMGGGGVDGAIHRAGGPAILRECRKLRVGLPHGLPAGEAVITTAGNLPAEWVIHTVGPMYNPRVDRSDALRSCYTESMHAADAVHARTVAFPLISSGVYGWPVEDAISQALTALLTVGTSVEEARLVLFDEATYRTAVRIAASVKATVI